MDPHNPTVYAPSSNSAPSMMLPEHVDGYIDLPTLADIHHFLCQSSLEEDQALAAWIKARYLYEPTTEAGREIRSTEGFSKLDRAYRRVRSLTNKAQDKWPFFDRNWKSMSTTAVRNNARGESAPGVSLPGMNSVVHDSPMTNGHDSRQAQTSSTLSPFVPFGTKQPNKYQQKSHPRQQAFSLPIPYTPIPLPPTKQVQLESRLGSEKPSLTQEQLEPDKSLQRERSSTQDLPKYADLFSRSESPTSARFASAQDLDSEAVKAPCEEPAEMPMNATDNSDAPQNGGPSQLSAEDVVQDAGGGKVRGPNGRYMPKDDTARGSRKSRRSIGGARAKASRRSRTATDIAAPLDQAETTSSTPANDEDETMVGVPSTPVQLEQSEMEQHDGSEGENVPAAEDAAPAPATEMGLSSARSLGEPSSDPPIDTTTNGMSIQPSIQPIFLDLDSHPPSETTPAYLTLAAEAEAVSSNLDKLPPNAYRKNKRKSEAAAHQGPPRKRGRPRKVDVEKNAEKAAENSIAKEPSTTLEDNIVVEEEPPSMATRRTTRRSAAGNVNPPTPAKPDTPKPTPNKLQQLAEDEDETMVDVDGEDATTSHKAPSPAPAQPEEQPVPTSSTKADLSTPKKVSQDTDADRSALGLRKTSSSRKRSTRQQHIAEEPAKGMNTLPNGTSKTALRSTIEPTKTLTNEPASDASAGAQLANGTSTNAVATLPSPTKVEYLARVHTSTGIVDIPMSHENLSTEAEVVQRYAEWMKTQGTMEISFETFKSIFCIAKKR
ncbi:hypothetical protein CC86DRAFT_370326 [Ophiobolus disseminans]|uniref:Uncharacterized protein n=1 Tax=Ophiobolus disseminans TaxID=1469910 RepID=A0A6A7A041_9PLEO|nr:hypothetical protein CC86DRAFT_370326 [Ophiobolus disseminans]